MSVRYLRHTVTYRDSKGRTCQALVRIREDITDRASDARRQLIGNHLPVAEILLVEEDS